MKKLTAIALALVMLVLAACGVQQTPVTATALPGESAEPTHSPPPEPFAESAAVEGTDYTLERYEFTDGYYTFNNGALWKSLDAVPMNSGTHWGIFELSGGEMKAASSHARSRPMLSSPARLSTWSSSGATTSAASI